MKSKLKAILLVAAAAIISIVGINSCKKSNAHKREKREIMKDALCDSSVKKFVTGQGMFFTGPQMNTFEDSTGKKFRMYHAFKVEGTDTSDFFFTVSRDNPNGFVKPPYRSLRNSFWVNTDVRIAVRDSSAAGDTIRIITQDTFKKDTLNAADTLKAQSPIKPQ